MEICISVFILLPIATPSIHWFINLFNHVWLFTYHFFLKLACRKKVSHSTAQLQFMVSYGYKASTDSEFDALPFFPSYPFNEANYSGATLERTRNYGMPAYKAYHLQFHKQLCKLAIRHHHYRA